MDTSRIELKLDAIESRLGSIDKTLAVNTEQLTEHMRRSLANEKAVDAIVKDLLPIKLHVSNIKFLMRLVGWAVGSGGILTLILWLLVRQRI